jgi:hypothetical protein
LALLLARLKGEKKLAGKACLPVLPIQTPPRLRNLHQLYKAKICQQKTFEAGRFRKRPAAVLESRRSLLFQPHSFTDC